MSTNYMKAQGLNQANMLLKLRNNYYTYSVNMFIWIDNGKYITAINKMFMRFFFNWITRMIFDDAENNFENNNILRIFINILGDFLDLISSK